MHSNNGRVCGELLIYLKLGMLLQMLRHLLDAKQDVNKTEISLHLSIQGVYKDSNIFFNESRNCFYICFRCNKNISVLIIVSLFSLFVRVYPRKDVMPTILYIQNVFTSIETIPGLYCS